MYAISRVHNANSSNVIVFNMGSVLSPIATVQIKNLDATAAAQERASKQIAITHEFGTCSPKFPVHGVERGFGLKCAYLRHPS
jgi:hypothetical protein